MKNLLSILAIITSISAYAADYIPEFEFVGASITRGVGAGQSLETRVESHLVNEPEIEQLRQSTVLFALDYFFITNFGSIRDGAVSEPAFEISVRSRINTWTQSHDKVVIGLLPVFDELSGAQQSFLNSERGRSLAAVYQVVNQCCSARAKKLNEILRSLANSSSNPNSKIYLFNPSKVIDWYLADTSLPSSSNLYGFYDKIHINSYGQSVFFNQALKPVLESMWSVRLSPME